MERKLSTRLIAVGLFSILVTTLLVSAVFFYVVQKQADRDLRMTAAALAQAYPYLTEVPDLDGFEADGLRITLIEPDGTVDYDSHDVDALRENHLSRPEVQEALTDGAGSARRTSTTLGYATYYYALRLDDGNILRLSMDVRSQLGMYTSALPMVLLCCLVVVVLSVALSIFTTRRLVRPIVEMGNTLDSIDQKVPYPELRPFVDAIVRDRELQKSNETMRQEFTANVSHELKTPLTSISGYAELIETGVAKPEDVRNFAGKIRKEAGRLIALVNDIIQLTKLDTAEQLAADPKKDFEPINLKNLIDSCSEALAVNAQRSYVTLLTAGEMVEISGSRTGLEELCCNLCDNAIRYNEPGGKVVLSCGKLDGKPFLRVQDNGIGIPEDQQQRIFERFYRVDKSRSKATGGTGLGLAIVKHIAAVHDAKINLVSKVGEGTEITVLFEQPENKKK